MKLAEVIEMFTLFGFTGSEVRYCLSSGDSAHNAFESLKIQLEMRWADINMSESPDKVKRLKPTYERLMGMTMKSRTTKADVEAKKKEKAKKLARDMMASVERQKQRNVEAFMETLGEKLNEKPLDDAAKARIRAAGLGALIDDE